MKEYLSPHSSDCCYLFPSLMAPGGGAPPGDACCSIALPSTGPGWKPMPSPRLLKEAGCEGAGLVRYMLALGTATTPKAPAVAPEPVASASTQWSVALDPAEWMYVVLEVR